MKGKNVLITGATGGIGRAAAEELARMGARVLGISRNPDKCSRVADEIQQVTGNKDVHYLCANLSSMAHVRQVAKDATAHFPQIHVLINNVGAIHFFREESADGFELTFALNHLSGFFLTNLLLDHLRSSAPARIINVSSSAQFNGKMHFDDLQLKRSYGFMKAYSQSKLANMLFTYELARRLEGSGVTVNAMHPGLVQTNIATNNNALVRLGQKIILRNSRTPEHGARTIVYLASSLEVEDISGKYFIDEKPVPSARASYNEADAVRLWSESEALLRPFQES